MTREMNKRIDELNLEELKDLDGEILTKEELSEIDYNENVIDSQCLGQSGLHTECNWHTITLLDETEIDLYVKRFDEENEEKEMEDLLINKGYYLESVNYTLSQKEWVDIYYVYRIACVQEVLYENYKLSVEKAEELAKEITSLIDDKDISETEAIEIIIERENLKYK